MVKGQVNDISFVVHDEWHIGSKLGAYSEIIWHVFNTYMRRRLHWALSSA